MNLLAPITVLALLLPPTAADPQDDPSTPAQQYAALLREYNPVSGGMRKSTTDLQRKTAVEQMAPFAARFLTLAEQHPDDPIALQAIRQAIQAMGTTDSAAQITWETNTSNFPAASTDESAAHAVALLLRDHVLSADLAPVCDRMRFGYRLEFDGFLQTVLEENPHREIQAVACLSLAQFLVDRQRMLQLVVDRADLTRRYDSVFGEDYLPGLQRLEREGLADRIEALLDRALQYDDVKTPTNHNIAEQARAALYDIRHLAVGKIAPDIVGVDQFGAPLVLSEHRGKVVLLSFWMEL